MRAPNMSSLSRSGYKSEFLIIYLVLFVIFLATAVSFCKRR